MTEPLNEKIKQATFINKSPEEVFDAITSAEAWNSFFTHNSSIDPKPGGEFIWRWKNWGPDSYTIEVPGKVIELVRPELFVFEWGNKSPSRITIKLQDSNGGTVLRLTEYGYINDSSGRAAALECAAGWGEALTLLKFYLEHGITYTSSTNS
ncbi:MAG: SRPBCC domain-containing protein [Planctomycetes bacterium]|nr:SRPBCC domain-containing protein [Planctomycetota bacterium]